MKMSRFTRRRNRHLHLFAGAVLVALVLARSGVVLRTDPSQFQKAARVETIFQSLRTNAPPSQKATPNSTFRISENELNAYLALRYVQKPHSGLKSMGVHLLANNQVAVDTVVNVDDLKTENSALLKMITLLFSGDQSLHVEARLIFRGDTVTYELEQAELNGVTLPNSVVEKMIEILARRQTQKIDVTKPIPLTPAIKHVEIRRGVLIIQT